MLILIFHKPERIILIGLRKDINYKNPDTKNVFKLIKEYALKIKKNNILLLKRAIGDLPVLKPREEGSDGWYSYYSGSAVKPYQKMRKDSYGVLNHKARSHMKSDVERYKFLLNIIKM